MDISVLFSAMPGAVAQGLIWGIMAIGVYITYKILDVADLTVDGSMCTGGAVSIMMMLNGYNVWVSLLAAFIAGMLAGLVTGIFHTFMGIPAILAGILTQLALYAVNLKIMGRANQAISVMNYDLLVSLRNVKNVPFYQNSIFVVAIFCIVIIGVLYWFFGTELGCSRGAIVIGLAAVIIGKVVFEKLFHNFALKLLSVVLGAVIYYAVLQVVIWFGLDTDLLKLLSALVVALFLALPYWKKKYIVKPVKRGGAQNVGSK